MCPVRRLFQSAFRLCCGFCGRGTQVLGLIALDDLCRFCATSTRLDCHSLDNLFPNSLSGVLASFKSTFSQVTSAKHIMSSKLISTNLMSIRPISIRLMSVKFTSTNYLYQTYLLENLSL